MAIVYDMTGANEVSYLWLELFLVVVVTVGKVLHVQGSNTCKQ